MNACAPTMSQQRLPFDLSTVTAVFSCFADDECRQVLSVLFALENESVTVRDLATYLVPAYSNRPLDEGVMEEVATVHRTLQNTYVPKLAEVGLITWERDVVSVTDHPVYGYDLIRDILSAELDREIEANHSIHSESAAG